MSNQDDFHHQLAIVRQQLDALLGGVTGDWSIIQAMNELAKAVELAGMLMASNPQVVEWCSHCEMWTLAASAKICSICGLAYEDEPSALP